MNDYRRYYWLYRLNIMFYVYMLVLIIIKISLSFAGHALRKILLPIFILDLIVSYFVIIGLYFELNYYIQTMYIFNGHYLLMLVYSIAANSLCFTASTIFKHQDFTYYWMIGFILMEISTGSVLYYFANFVPNLTMSTTRYKIVFIFISILNFYIALNAYLMVNLRLKKYYESDSIYAFYCIWTDWFSFFWIDLRQF